jgi:hypothetical protein
LRSSASSNLFTLSESLAGEEGPAMKDSLPRDLPLKIGLSCRTHVITENLAPEKEVGEGVEDRGDGGDEDFVMAGK